MAAGKNNIAKESAERVIAITHVIDVPRSCVFKAWTDPKLVAQRLGS